MLRVISFLYAFLTSLTLAAQADDIPHTYLTIDTITIAGNRKTKPAWILRELEFGPGDSISIAELGRALDRNRLRLMNTGLFNEAKINVRDWFEDNCIHLHIEITEAWYLYPIPGFTLADRNFNVWWNEFDGDLNRVYYGLTLNHTNLTGRADNAKIGFQLGYAQKFEATYIRPGINRRQTLGLELGFWFSRQRETFLKTSGNILRFFSNGTDYMISRRRLNAALVWRPGLFTFHTLNLERHDNHVADTIARELNPDFFLRGKTRQRHWSLIFTVSRDLRDIRPFPLHGWYMLLEMRQNGLLPSDDLHLFRLLGEVDKYFAFSKVWSLETVLAGRTSLPRRKNPYFNNQALGYDGYFVRGYEYYVADGLDFGLAKSTLRCQVFNRTINFGKLMPLKSFRLFPVKVYLTLHNDLGFSNDPHYAEGNPLANRLLWGHGLGLYLVGYYNRVAKLEWSRNHLGQSGFYFGVNSGI